MSETQKGDRREQTQGPGECTGFAQEKQTWLGWTCTLISWISESLQALKSLPPLTSNWDIAKQHE